MNNNILKIPFCPKSAESLCLKNSNEISNLHLSFTRRAFCRAKYKSPSKKGDVKFSGASPEKVFARLHSDWRKIFSRIMTSRKTLYSVLQGGAVYCIFIARIERITCPLLLSFRAFISQLKDLINIQRVEKHKREEV